MRTIYLCPLGATKKNIIKPDGLTDTPLAFRFNLLAKKYVGAASKQFDALDLERNFFILNLISKHPDITQQCLANCLEMDKAAIVRVINYLSVKGLVKREAGMKDRREHRISITPKAQGYVNKISEGFKNLNKSAFKGFSATEKNTFLNMLDRMQENLSALPAENYSLKYIKTAKAT